MPFDQLTGGTEATTASAPACPQSPPSPPQPRDSDPGRSALTVDPEPGCGPDAPDHRFQDAAWRQPPFSFWAAAQLAAEAQWRAAASALGEPGLQVRRLEFWGRLALDAVSPTNFPWTNPQVLDATLRSGGMNFVAGAALFASDLSRLAAGGGPPGLAGFKVGETMALTPGAVIFRNELMELIQYAPTTAKVRRQPVLITPAWLMKYYVLDLTPPDSLVRYLVEQGFTVFVISWRNPGPEMRATAFDDYRRQGVLAAIEAVGEVMPGETVHAVGYCLGGTLLAVTAAAMQRDGDDRLASITLVAAQIDFSEPGDLMMFMDEGHVVLLEAMMQAQGCFDAKAMSGAFRVMRAKEMLFARLAERYLLGKSRPLTDIDAWLADPTRIPARTHSEYLHMVLDNSFSAGVLQVGNRPAGPEHIRTPVFVLGAEQDQIAPWRSLLQTQFEGAADVTFVLTGGGHVTGVVSPPGKPGAYYHRGVRPAPGAHINPDGWLAATPRQSGSWWPEWIRWLDERSVGLHCTPPLAGGPPPGLCALAPAPGAYVFQV